MLVWSMRLYLPWSQACVLEAWLSTFSHVGRVELWKCGAYHKAIRSPGHHPQIRDWCCFGVGSHKGELSGKSVWTLPGLWLCCVILSLPPWCHQLCCDAARGSTDELAIHGLSASETVSYINPTEEGITEIKPGASCISSVYSTSEMYNQPFIWHSASSILS